MGDGSGNEQVVDISSPVPANIGEAGRPCPSPRPQEGLLGLGFDQGAAIRRYQVG
jgi:hypothetical protein